MRQPRLEASRRPGRSAGALKKLAMGPILHIVHSVICVLWYVVYIVIYIYIHMYIVHFSVVALTLDIHQPSDKRVLKSL